LKDKFYNLFKLVSEYALYGLLFFIPISISLVEVFAALMFIGFVGRKIIKPDFKFLKFRPNIFLLLFFLFSALSLFNSGAYLNKGIHALFGKWAQYLGICFIAQDTIYDNEIVKRGIFVFLFSAALVTFSGLSQWFFQDEFLRHKSMTVMDNGMRAITSSFAHYNSLGGYLVVVLSLVTALLLADNCYGLKAVSLPIFSMFSTAAIMLTFSRGSWIALAVSFIFTLMLTRKNLIRFIPIFLVIIGMFLFSAFHERLLLIFKPGGDADRFKYWSVAFKMINEHPFFGTGVGTFMANFSKYMPSTNISYAHNCYFQIWAETGIFALISFVTFVVSIIYLGTKKFLVSKDYLLLGLLSGVAGFLVHSFFEVNLYSLQLAFLFWVWIGLIVTRLRIVN
jgi:putative inorganic carbon (HCO3(-)) transporter